MIEVKWTSQSLGDINNIDQNFELEYLRNTLLFILILSSTLLSKGQSYVITYAGKVSPGFVNGDTSAARFNKPFGLCMDKSSNLYVADANNHSIRKINTVTHTVTMLAGTGIAGYADGPAASAKFNSPSDLCADDSGNIFVSDFLNHRIRKISVNGIVSTVAGNGTANYQDGTAANASFNYPRGIVIDKYGNLYIGDSWNHRIRKISASGNVITYAGGGAAKGANSAGSYVDAKDTSARFNTPSGISIDQYSNLYVADAYNHRLRKIDTAGMVTTIAGSGSTGPGNGGFADGNVLTALLNTPTELFADASGKIYISDTFSNRIRMLSGNILSTLAGNGTAGYKDGADSSAQFNYPRGIVVDGNGSKIYVVDYNNNAVRLLVQGVGGVGEESSTYSGKVKIYPNPNNGVFQITIPDNNKSVNAVCMITDVLGREMFNSLISLIPSCEVALPWLPEGVYSVVLTVRDNIVVKKIVILQ